ncbi:uncharacterized protein LOC112556799 isoform X1 [Pomacea canaliculata]|uniref:uncharacterized protein LOC112556799 isoform X1 n=1 Tax=Pomacea canaliculata TaxID=400727 RepID=UPI000D728842|nr:uncharacterized protein LOC112556799 isoform X1 [Pomacea canaliculata]
MSPTLVLLLLSLSGLSWAFIAKQPPTLQASVPSGNGQGASLAGRDIQNILPAQSRRQERESAERVIADILPARSGSGEKRSSGGGRAVGSSAERVSRTSSD